MNIIGKISIITVLCCASSVAFSDEIEIVVAGQNGGSGGGVTNTIAFDKKMEKDGTFYGLRKYTVNNAFSRFTIRTSSDNVNWSEERIVLSASDLAGKGNIANEDYTKSQLRAVKWVECPATGNMSLWAKRHGVDQNGNRIVRKELMRAAILGSGKNPSDRYDDSIIINRPYGNSSGDLGLFSENNTQYIVSADTDEDFIQIIRMRNNCSDVAINGPHKTLSWLEENSDEREAREAPSLFKRNGNYFLFTSGKTGWRPNQQKYSVASSLTGDWSELKDVGDATGYHSQLFGTQEVVSEINPNVSSRIFSGSRNANSWGETGSRRIWMPLYFNTGTEVATNYYDYISINRTRGEVTGYQYDNGTQLSISSIGLANGSNQQNVGLDNLIDDDLDTAWYNNNDENARELILDLGSEQLVKGLKLKLYDLYGPNNLADVSYRTMLARIEVGDGNEYQTGFQGTIGSIAWLQSINIRDLVGRFVRISLIDSYRTRGNDAIKTNDFGFYELQVWGNEKRHTPQIEEDFASYQTGQALANEWLVQTPNDTEVEIARQTRKVLRLIDNNANDRLLVSQEFEAQKSNNLQVSFSIRFNQLARGEFVRLFGDGQMAINITSSVQNEGLAFTDSEFSETTFANIARNTWYNIELRVNTDAGTYDIYVNDILIWGGAKLANPVTRINRIQFGTRRQQVNSTFEVDNVRVHGPLFNNSEPPSNIAFTDDFSNNQLNNWEVQSGDWEIGQNGNLVNTDDGNDLIVRGNANLADYSVTATLRGDGGGAAILGRYSNANRFYQLALLENETFVLSKRTPNGWATLATDEVANLKNFNELKLSFQGSSIVASVNQAIVANVQDTDNASGRVGIKMIRGTGQVRAVSVINH